jgi:hypothetical protein
MGSLRVPLGGRRTQVGVGGNPGAHGARVHLQREEGKGADINLISRTEIGAVECAAWLLVGNYVSFCVGPAKFFSMALVTTLASYVCWKRAGLMMGIGASLARFMAQHLAWWAFRTFLR